MVEFNTEISDPLYLEDLHGKSRRLPTGRIV